MTGPQLTFWALDGSGPEMLAADAYSNGRSNPGLEGKSHSMITDPLEPQKPESRARFNRYRRLMLHAVWLGPLILAPILIVTIAIANIIGVSRSTFSTIVVAVGMGWLIAVVGFMAYCEVQRTLVFRDDLRQRSEAAPRADDP